MDLAARKNNFIQEIKNVEKESVIDALERVLKRENEEHQKMPSAHAKELDERLASYHNNPDDLLDWDDIKNE